MAAHSSRYLTGLLRRAFPHDQSEQRRRVSEIISRIYGDSFGQRQISEIFGAPRLVPGPAIEAAVKRLAAPEDRKFVERQAAASRLRSVGYANDVTRLLQPVKPGMPRLARRPGPAITPGIGRIVVAAVIGLVLAGAVALALYLTLHL